jgi:hypothetical protein
MEEETRMEIAERGSGEVGSVRDRRKLGDREGLVTSAIERAPVEPIAALRQRRVVRVRFTGRCRSGKDMRRATNRPGGH